MGNKKVQELFGAVYMDYLESLSLIPFSMEEGNYSGCTRGKYTRKLKETGAMDKRKVTVVATRPHKNKSRGSFPTQWR